MAAPLGLNVVLVPAQIVAPLTLMVGVVFTVTVSVCGADTQFWDEVPVTVYTLVLAGVTMADPLE